MVLCHKGNCKTLKKKQLESYERLVVTFYIILLFMSVALAIQISKQSWNNPTQIRWFELDTVLIHRQKSLFLTLSRPHPPPPNCFSNDFSCRRRRTWFTHVRVAIWSKIIQVFYDNKWPYDHFGGLYDGEFIWLYGNVIFIVIRCSPSRRESIL